MEELISNYHAGGTGVLLPEAIRAPERYFFGNSYRGMSEYVAAGQGELTGKLNETRDLVAPCK